ncbi:hypothetical protein C9J27_05610 [Photobacterium kishitanii]|uniref:Uncharacterized protein n=1 Tax=Photobacterium kishitanii TaxID=318456 RepID=A0A2T3KLR2_9GAMM|nr:hypothetical protein C9J27_05610 [Photobacterium kishitanii]
MVRLLMTNNLIKIKESQSQGIREEAEHVWCALVCMDSSQTLCGDSVDDDNLLSVDYKIVARGGITCPICLSIIKEIKAIRL